MPAITTTIAAADAVRADLDAILDALGANHEQGLVIFRPETEEVDSLIERLDLFDRLVASIDWPNDRVRAFFTRLIDDCRNDVWHVAELNGRERQFERHAAGSLEGVWAALRTSHVARKDLAAELRPVLRTIAAVRAADTPNPPADQVTLALGTWRRIGQQVPADILGGERLAHELGRGPSRTLADLLAGTVPASRRGRS